MKWSWRLTRVFGIDLYVHATFLILLAFAAWTGYRPRHLVADAVDSVLFVGFFFVIVVLHELGHCLTARRFGIVTHDITLLPIGGMARLARMPEKPWQELVIALAGPAVNVVIGLLLYAVLRAPETDVLLSSIRLAGGQLLINLFKANALMALFNLVPAFPMDGGRVLRALLAMRWDYTKATSTAAAIGQALAWGFGAIGLLHNVWWLVIAIFVFLGAEAEEDLVKTRSVLGTTPVADVMVREFRALAPTDPLSLAVQHVVAGFQQDFPVVDQGRVAGVLTRARLLAGLAKHGESARVGDHMVRDFRTAQAAEPAEQALQRLQDCDCHAMPVLQDGALAGMLTADNLGEFVMIRAALKGERIRRPLI